VQLGYEAEGKWQRRQALDTVLQGSDIVANFSQVIGASFNRRSGVGCEQLAERSLCPFDATRQYGFLLDEGSYEQMGIREAPSFTSQFPDKTVSVGQ
jgi:hypothetical protein